MSFLSKSHYLCCKSLHSLPKFASRTQRIQAANGQFISILFIIPIIIDIHGHRFQIYVTGIERGLKDSVMACAWLRGGIGWGCWWMCRYVGMILLCMCKAFPALRGEQTIMTSLDDVTIIPLT